MTDNAFTHGAFLPPPPEHRIPLSRRSANEMVDFLKERIQELTAECARLRRNNNELLLRNHKLNEDKERIARGAPVRVQPIPVLCTRHRLCVYLDGHIGGCQDATHRMLSVIGEVVQP